MKHVTPTLSKSVIGKQEISFNTRTISLHLVGRHNNMWTVDHGGSVNCFGIDLNQRCFSYGLTWVPIVSIGDAYTQTKKPLEI